MQDCTQPTDPGVGRNLACLAHGTDFQDRWDNRLCGTCREPLEEGDSLLCGPCVTMTKIAIGWETAKGATN